MNSYYSPCIYTIVFIITSISIHLTPLISAQQPYVSNICPPLSKLNTSIFGNSCNGINTTCQTYLIYRTQPPYNKLSTIASLFSVNVSHLSSINNNISIDSPFSTNTEIIVPVTCSCSGKFYQVNTSYSVVKGDNYYAIANNTFEGLTTCRAIRVQKKSPNVVNIYPNEKLTIPIRCACPTKGQVDKGIKYLMSFVVQDGNSFSDIATKFGADVGQTLDANEKSEQDSVIYPFTTILVPLKTPPNGSILEYPGLISSPPPMLEPFPSPSVPSTSNSSSSSDRKWVFFGVGLVAGAAFVSVIGVFVIIVLVRMMRKKKEQIVSPMGIESQEKPVTKELNTEPLVCLKNICGIASLKVYTSMDLQVATENFSSRNWIKGSVYKGVLDGDEVAIKKMNGDVSKEISVLNKINHLNLIRLLGVCFNDGVWYLVYEYACNGPLSEWIYQNNPDKRTLTWAKRMQVAFDVASGLNYLHRYTTPPYVHKDIKSRNILIDSNLRAKISRFGLSRPVRGNIDSQFTLTKHIVGTKGYLAPEYVENGLVSPMLDVYSFGVLLLEMLTGKDVPSLYEGVKVHLSEVLTPIFNEGGGKSKLVAFMDPSLGENYQEEMAMSLIGLVDRCLKKDPGIRPSMDEIVQILSKTLTDSLIWESSSTSISL